MFSYKRLYFSSVGCYFSFPICDFIWVLSHFLSFFFFKYFIYVFMWDTERQRERQRENEPPVGPDVGHDSPRPRGHDLSQSRCSNTEAPRCLADSIALLLMGLFTFSISSYFSFACLHISRDLSISSRSPSFLAYNFIVFPYNCLIFLVLIVISLLSFVILFI